MPARIQANLHPFATIFSILYIAFVFCPVFVARADLRTLDGTFLSLVILAVLLTSAVSCALLAATKVPYKYAEPVLTATLLLFFIFATIVPRQAGMLDGQQMTGRAPPDWYWINLLCWFVLLLVSWILRDRLRAVAIPILLLCAGYTLYDRLLPVDDKSILPIEQAFKQKDDFATLSSKQNVIVLAVDMLQGSIVERAFHEYPHTLSEFDGFTIFTRGITSFPFTNFAKPSILSGKTYATDHSQAAADHWRAAENDSFATDLLQAGYAVRSIDFLSYIGKGVQTQTISSAGFLGEGDKISHSAYVYGYACAAGFARIIGVWPENPFFGEITDFVLSVKLRSVAVAHDLSRLIRRREDVAPRALLFWNYTAHAPVALERTGTVSPNNPGDEGAVTQEALLVFDQLQSLFTSLKKSDVYDNSLIIVVSDHGHPSLANRNHLQKVPGLEDAYNTGGNYLNVSMYNATLWVKPPFSRGAAVISNEPAWNGDVRAVVKSYLDDFSNQDAKALLRNIRSKKPDIDVLYLTDRQVNPQYHSEFHKLAQTRSIERLHEEFIEKSKKDQSNATLETVVPGH